MSEFCEFEIDFEQFKDLRVVRVCDECGEHEDVWFYRLDELKAENAKLCELVRDMWGWLTTSVVGGATLYDLAGRMHELGIEVES